MENTHLLVTGLDNTQSSMILTQDLLFPRLCTLFRKPIKVKEELGFPFENQ